MKLRLKQFVIVGTVVALFLTIGYLLHINNISRICQAELRLADFGFVRLGIPFDEVVERVGEPNAPGVSMHEYDLDDCSSQVVLRMSWGQLAGIWIQHEDGTRVDFFSGEVLKQPSLEDFSFLERRYFYSEVIRRVGEPNSEGGSGLHMAIYKLSDGGTMILKLNSWFEQDRVDYIVADAWISKGDSTPVNFFQQ